MSMSELSVTSPEPSSIAVFRNRPFLLLWLSQLATQVGGNMVLYGLTVLVRDLTSSNSAVSICEATKRFQIRPPSNATEMEKM